MAMPSSNTTAGPFGAWPQPSPAQQSAWQSAQGTGVAASPVAPPTPRRLSLSPSGMTPQAKRPMDRDAIQVALTGERPLTHEELTSAFYALNRRLDKEEAFTAQMREAIIHNADLVDQAGARGAQSSVALGVVPTKID